MGIEGAKGVIGIEGAIGIEEGIFEVEIDADGIGTKDFHRREHACSLALAGARFAFLDHMELPCQRCSLLSYYFFFLFCNSVGQFVFYFFT